MEFTQSRNLRAMAAEYALVGQPQAPEVSFIDEMFAAWNQLLGQIRDDGQLGAVVQPGDLVPWQMGPIPSVRRNFLRGQRTDFAIAYTVLARRHLTLANDFFNAMLGMLDQHSGIPLAGNASERMCQLAKRCMIAGDLSPLFLVPTSLETPPRPPGDAGYVDPRKFGLSVAEQLPTYPTATLEEATDTMRFQAENLGTVGYVVPAPHIADQKAYLVSLCKLTLLTTGSNLEDFVGLC